MRLRIVVAKTMLYQDFRISNHLVVYYVASITLGLLRLH